MFRYRFRSDSAEAPAKRKEEVMGYTDFYKQYEGESWYPYEGPGKGHYRAGGAGPIMPHVFVYSVTTVDHLRKQAYKQKVCKYCGVPFGKPQSIPYDPKMTNY